MLHCSSANSTLGRCRSLLKRDVWREPTAEMGQTEKNSVRAYVFRFAPKSGHCATESACPFRAKPGRTQGEQISSEMRSRADIETASRRSVSQKATQHGQVGSRVRPLSRI